MSHQDQPISTDFNILVGSWLTLSPRGSELYGFYGGWANSAPPMENPFMGCFCHSFKVKLNLYINIGLMRKETDSQNSKIEEVEEL